MSNLQIIDNEKEKQTMLAIMAEFNANSMVFRLKDVKTVNDSISCNIPSLANITKKLGREISITWLKVWILMLNEQINVKRKMEDSNIEFAAEVVYQEFYYLKISDFKIVSIRMLRGDYKLYEGLDCSKILNILVEYSNERANIAQDRPQLIHIFNYQLEAGAVAKNGVLELKIPQIPLEIATRVKVALTERTVDANNTDKNEQDIS